MGHGRSRRGELDGSSRIDLHYQHYAREVVGTSRPATSVAISNTPPLPPGRRGRPGNIHDAAIMSWMAGSIVLVITLWRAEGASWDASRSFGGLAA